MADLIPADTLTEYLHDHIPLTRHMGIVVAECSRERIVLRAPLAPNVNHRETAFGGSLSGAAILAGWAWLHARLSREWGPRLVVQESTMTFEQPVTATFEAICDSPPDAEFERFKTALERRGKARMTLESRIVSGSRIVARHTGRYVAVVNRSRDDIDAS